MKTYTTEIYIWSAIGNTPITNRKGAFCDVLEKSQIECESPQDAIEKVKAKIANTKFAAKGYFNMPSHPNQNTRSKFLGIA